MRIKSRCMRPARQTLRAARRRVRRVPRPSLLSSASENAFGMAKRLQPALLLIALVVRVDAWGYCNDEDVSCANWAQSGHCDGDNSEVVRKKCPHSCGVCTHLCRDTDPQCPEWAHGGAGLSECTENAEFMLKHCPVSCGICKSICHDKKEECNGWARAGECEKNPAILSSCPVSCGICNHRCLDFLNDCPGWAAAGECHTNPGHMLKACPNSCNVCDHEEHGKKCVDRDVEQCLIWGEHECMVNPEAVIPKCPRTCGLCSEVCEDKREDCPNWAAAKGGKGCEADAEFMMLHCPFTCGVCSKLQVFHDGAKDEV